MPDDNSSHLQPIGWLLGFDVDPDTMSRDEIERRLRVANDALWRELNGATDDDAPREQREKRQG